MSKMRLVEGYDEGTLGVRVGIGIGIEPERTPGMSETSFLLSIPIPIPTPTPIPLHPPTIRRCAPEGVRPSQTHPERLSNNPECGRNGRSQPRRVLALE